MSIFDMLPSEEEIARREKEAEVAVSEMKLPVSPEEWDKLGYHVHRLLFKQETEWEPFEDKTPILESSTQKCPRCNDRGDWSPVTERGVTTGALSIGKNQPCNCVFRRAFWHYIEETLPPRYRDYMLKTLRVSEKSRLSPAAQQKLYDLLRAKPNDGYALFGPVGTSKTTVTTALYRYQLRLELLEMFQNGVYRYTAPERNQIPVWRTDCKTLLLQHHDWAINRPVVNAEGVEVGGRPEPDITRRRIERYSKRGRKCHIFLEEIDKVELTKARRDTLFDVWNAGYEHEAQMVINSNLTKDEFQNMYGAEFVRRIIESCTVIDLFSKEWQ